MDIKRYATFMADLVLETNFSYVAGLVDNTKKEVINRDIEEWA